MLSLRRQMGEQRKNNGQITVENYLEQFVNGRGENG